MTIKNVAIIGTNSVSSNSRFMKSALERKGYVVAEWSLDTYFGIKHLGLAKKAVDYLLTRGVDSRLFYNKSFWLSFIKETKK